MLRLSKLADYGTVVMVFLARHSHCVCSAREIAQHTHLAVPTVSKLLKRLAQAGLLDSMRGSAGGYRLKRKASEISVAEIIYAFEGARGLTECSSSPDGCSLHQVCHVQSRWQFISQVIESVFAGISLDALAQPDFKPSFSINLGH